MGLSSDEFYSLTPRQLDALMLRLDRKNIDQELLFAQVASCIVNFSMARPKEPSKIADFMPSEWMKRSIARTKRLTDQDREQIANRMRSIAEAFVKEQQDAEQGNRCLLGR